MKQVCPCGSVFEVAQHRVKNGRGKYCGQKCKYKYRTMPKRGIGTYNCVKHNHTQFKPNHLTWNKGTIGICRPNSGSIKRGQRLSPKTEFKIGDVPHNYKGTAVGYFALHAWVTRKKGKATKCKDCGSTNHVMWANVSHTYLRDVDDYIEKCAKCHQKHDRPLWGDATRRWNLPGRKQKNTI